METTTLRRVKPTRPIAAYIGGKLRLAPLITQKIAEVPHRSYIEPFIGMGGIFLRREAVPPVEVMNDISGDVVNLFRIAQRHCDALEDAFRFHITSRSVFERFRRTEPSELTDIERAVRFLYLQRAAFGGKVAGRSFGVSASEPGSIDHVRLTPLLRALSARLAGVVIENLPYADVIERYDRPASLFYLDPPYYGGEADYGSGVFERRDFERLAELLGQLQGRFIVSINDVPEIRRIFSGFHMMPLKLKYSIAQKASTEAAELLILDARTAAMPARQSTLFGV
ncbi:MAG: DNA methyltransferase [Ancylobacter novellus]|uniref:site-specific DNA-methyltransferase (adenine-specific) n=1 Tax=Ancylobacter novellus TaxID=921 RepID=A0A2W5R1C0_ANCNO|nr:MAG: DNA methyltransferase [Ancylobacter novellus]